MQLDSHAADLLLNPDDLIPFEVFLASSVGFPCIYALFRAQGAHFGIAIHDASFAAKKEPHIRPKEPH